MMKHADGWSTHGKSVGLKEDIQINGAAGTSSSSHGVFGFNPETPCIELYIYL